MLRLVYFLLPSSIPIEKKSIATSFESAAVIMAAVLNIPPIRIDVLFVIKCIPSVITSNAEIKNINGQYQWKIL